MSRQGPGVWLHWHCADRVTNDPKWEDKWWIPIPKNYEAKHGGTCGFCGNLIIEGDRVAKVMIDARTVWT